MRIVFCNIAWMKYYQGIWDGDQPQHGGAWLSENNDANECFNFSPMDVQFSGPKYPSGSYCLGFYETSRDGVAAGPLHIERLEGIGKGAREARDVLVIWCAKAGKGRSVVVGWYKCAIAFRDYQALTLNEDGRQVDIVFNVLAKSDDCVLLPAEDRMRPLWRAPQLVEDGYGFGQSTIWYPSPDCAQLSVLLQAIESYHGQNWTGFDLSNAD